MRNVLILGGEKKFEELASKLKSRGYNVMIPFVKDAEDYKDYLDEESLLISTKKGLEVVFKVLNKKVKGAFFVMDKDYDLASLKGYANKFFIYIQKDDKDINATANYLETETMVIEDEDELIEEVLIDIISLEHS